MAHDYGPGFCQWGLDVWIGEMLHLVRSCQQDSIGSGGCSHYDAATLPALPIAIEALQRG